MQVFSSWQAKAAQGVAYKGLTPEHLSAGCSATFSRPWSPFKRPGSFKGIKGSRTVMFFCTS